MIHAPATRPMAPHKISGEARRTMGRSRLPPPVALALAAAAVLGLLAWIRLSTPLPWSYDEYYHLALAREMLSGARLETFPWAPFSILHDRFVDGAPLFHLLLVPLAGLSVERGARLGAVLGQAFVVASFAWALRALRVPRPWWFLLALPALGTLFLQRLEMCRPHVWLVGFSALVLALLVERRWWGLFVASALFGLTHVGGWIAVPMAAVWALAGPLARGERGARERDPRGKKSGAAGGWLGRVGWQGVAAAACGWLLGQLLHPQAPDNFALLWMSSVVIPFQAAAGGDEALRSQLGRELAPPGLDLLLRQWPAFVAPLLVLAQLVREPRLRTRATLAAGAVALAFLGVGCLLARRFLSSARPSRCSPWPWCCASGGRRGCVPCSERPGGRSPLSPSPSAASGRWGCSVRTASGTPPRPTPWRAGWASTAGAGSASSRRSGRTRRRSSGSRRSCSPSSPSIPPPSTPAIRGSSPSTCASRTAATRSRRTPSASASARAG